MAGALDREFSRPLTALRFPVERSRGRRFPEFPHPYRNDFQRDRDRVVHARAFRRLENKTQVFTPGLSDHFRNRLTHTIEVSQVARTAAAALGLNEDFTEALALAHDIGHPPFAHAGELELDRMMQAFGERFDHNLHALRIVEGFENPYARFPGLNLTFEVREGIVKHSRDFARGEFPELDEYLPDLRPPMEAQLIDLCDEIAYNAADLDDAYSAGMVDVEAAKREVAKFAELWEEAEYQFPGASDRVRMHEIVRALLDAMVGGLLRGTVAAADGLADFEAVRSAEGRIVRFTDEAAQCSRQLKSFLRGHVYEADVLEIARHDSVGRISGLFEFFLAHPERMPEYYREQSAGQPLHRQVCDYIAGMTDGYFLKTCELEGVG
ncbi:MAG: dGTP triphosphohydrolase [Acidobacteriota bacterium]